LPSITPGYLYTIIALIAVSTLLSVAFLAYANAFRASSETKQLKNLMDYVAAKGTELLTLALTTNATAETFVQMPTTIGDKQYWLQLKNNSAEAWLEGGFGNTPTEATDLKVYLPQRTSAGGYYLAGYGAAYLECHARNSMLQLNLTSSRNSG
jgi:hypothetical protein